MIERGLYLTVRDLNIISLSTFWVSHDMSMGHAVWDRDCNRERKKKKKKVNHEPAKEKGP